MSEESKMSMMLCRGLEPVEQAKVERLDVPISEKTFARICQARIDGDRRALDFCDLAGTVVMASVWASEFLAASDADAVAMITLRSSN